MSGHESGCAAGPEPNDWPTRDCTCGAERRQTETQEAAEFSKGCECDGCCRLYELQVKFGLDIGNAYETADEIAGGIGTIFDLMKERIEQLEANK